MRLLLRAAACCLFLSCPVLAKAQSESDDWLLAHPFEQPDRLPHGDGEVLELREWERAVFRAEQYRHRKQAEEWARRAVSLPPANYARSLPTKD